MGKIRKTVLLTVIFVLGLVFVAGNSFASLASTAEKYNFVLSVIENAFHRQLTTEEEDYIKKVQKKALKKIVSSLKDKHAVLLSQKEVKDYLSVGFEGIGIYLMPLGIKERIDKLKALLKKHLPHLNLLDEDFEKPFLMMEMGEWLAEKDKEFAKVYHAFMKNTITEKGILVSGVLEGGAKEAGVEKDWRFTEVNRKSIIGQTLEDVVDTIRGPAGSKVDITFILPDGSKKVVNITRKKVKTSYLESKIISDGVVDIAYLRLTSFYNQLGRNAYLEMKEVLEKADADGVKDYIIDIRNNGGGDMRIVHQIAEMFLSEGLVIGYQKYKDDIFHPAISENSFKLPKDAEIVVLINGNSASASEILTMAMKDHKRALVIGEKTHGKGSIQPFIRHRDGSAFKITGGYFYSPIGKKCFDGVGIEPDVKITDDPNTPQDEVLEKAKKILNKIKSVNP